MADWLVSCYKSLPPWYFALGLIITWFTCYHRNSIWHGSEIWTVDTAYLKICSFAKQFANTSSLYDVSCLQCMDRWATPPAGAYKFNSDTSFDNGGWLGALRLLAETVMGLLLL